MINLVHSGCNGQCYTLAEFLEPDCEDAFWKYQTGICYPFSDEKWGNDGYIKFDCFTDHMLGSEQRETDERQSEWMVYLAGAIAFLSVFVIGVYGGYVVHKKTRGAPSDTEANQQAKLLDA